MAEQLVDDENRRELTREFNLLFGGRCWISQAATFDSGEPHQCNARHRTCGADGLAKFARPVKLPLRAQCSRRIHPALRLRPINAKDRCRVRFKFLDHHIAIGDAVVVELGGMQNHVAEPRERLGAKLVIIDGKVIAADTEESRQAVAHHFGFGHRRGVGGHETGVGRFVAPADVNTDGRSVRGRLLVVEPERGVVEIKRCHHRIEGEVAFGARVLLRQSNFRSGSPEQTGGERQSNQCEHALDPFPISVSL